MVSDTRPKNLNLFTISFPIPAIVSILHRISGFILFLFIPIALWGLHFSLTEMGFLKLQQWSNLVYVKLIIWLFLIPFFYHLVAGIRHLFADIHVGDTLRLGRITAILTFIIATLLIILAGIWLW
jgi:succinate dehydrogenase / fumarate reductase, cytochrome b subunit